ncbi:MAG: integrase [Lentisphaerae bacterium]|nr:integrase [Lentisphaerota bacterium]
MKMNDLTDISNLSLDDQFIILLHKKIMDKKGSAMRRAKKYYKDQYKKTGRIPKPLLLAGHGIMDGRRCSGRPRALPNDVKNRFIEMVKASCDISDHSFIYIPKKARKITTYHKLLETEFQKKISLCALYRLVQEEDLKLYLEQPDFDDTQISKGYFNPEKIFDLVQVDGCHFQYFKIRDEHGNLKKPQVIEFYDTGSRYMFVLECYFSETSQNAVDLFSRFLSEVPFPQKKIRLRPDRAKGFLNLKRPIHELNLKYSVPDGFYLDPDFSAARSPKHKVHLESSHRSLHNFEILIIKRFEDKIITTEPGFIFKGGKKEQVMITCLDITLYELRQSRILELYRREHNESFHRFSEQGKVQKWIPDQKLHTYLADQDTLNFDAAAMDSFMKYGLNKKRATVNRDRTIIYDKQKYVIVVGAEKFNTYKSKAVKVSYYNNKLYLFEDKEDGICLGEAICQMPSQKPLSVLKKAECRLKKNEVEQIARYLENNQMSVDMKALIAGFQDGLTLRIAKTIFEKNKDRYIQLGANLQNQSQIGFVMFNAFLIDFKRYRQKKCLPQHTKDRHYGI